MMKCTIFSFTVFIVCCFASNRSSGEDLESSKKQVVIGWEYLLAIVALFLAIFYFYQSKQTSMHHHEMENMRLKSELEFLKRDLLNSKEEHEEIRKQNIHLQANVRVYKENELRERGKRRQRNDSGSVVSEGSVASENYDVSIPVDRTITRGRVSTSSYPSVQNYFISLPADGLYEPVQDSGFLTQSNNNDHIGMYDDDKDEYS